MRSEIFNSLFDGATDNPETGKWYVFQYEPKFKHALKQWDEYPLIHVMEFKKGNLLGANIHYMNVRARLGAINNNRFPASTLHYYIPKNADSIFFEVDDLESELEKTKINTQDSGVIIRADTLGSWKMLAII